MDFPAMFESARPILIAFGLKLLGAIAAYIVGRTVRMIGLFNTTIDSPDNVQTMVGNAKIMGGTIKNFSHNAYRRVELLAQIDHTVDAADAIRRLREVLPRIANVMPDPKPDV